MTTKTPELSACRQGLCGHAIIFVKSKYSQNRSDRVFWQNKKGVTISCYCPYKRLELLINSWFLDSPVGNTRLMISELNNCKDNVFLPLGDFTVLLQWPRCWISLMFLRSVENPDSRVQRDSFKVFKESVSRVFYLKMVTMIWWDPLLITKKRGVRCGVV